MWSLPLRCEYFACRLGDGVDVSLLVVVVLVLVLVQFCCVRAVCALVEIVLSRAEAVLHRASSQDVLRARPGLPGQEVACRRLGLRSVARLVASPRVWVVSVASGQSIRA